jgi:hypothetical protein
MRQITRTNPGCVIILIDQSGSMGGAFRGNPRVRKCEVAADSTNELLSGLCSGCSRIEGQSFTIGHYFDVGVIGYGGPYGVGPAFTHPQLFNYLAEI